MTAGPVVVGIDGGGGHVGAVALADGEVVFRGEGGPGNPLAVDRKTLERSYADALVDCPSPTHVGVCAAGAGSQTGREVLTELVERRFPSAAVRVGADYMAVLFAAAGYDLWVMAGTGSVIASIDGATVRSSGGRGWLLGDHGSASRLGRALLEVYVNDPDPALAAKIEEVAGTADWPSLVTRAQSGSQPAAWMARFAPLLTGYAQVGVPWAAAVLDVEMAGLAATTAAHARAWLMGRTALSVCLTGGVWRSVSASAAFEAELRRYLPQISVEVRQVDAPVGAAQFACHRGAFAGSLPR